MSPSSNLPLWIDTDNALGAKFGDIDDAFAISLLLKSKVSVLGISNIFGNTFQSSAYQNSLSLAKLCDYRGPVFKGADHWWSKESTAAQELINLKEDFRFVGLGPLTNLALALRNEKLDTKKIKEVIFVGTNVHHQLPTMRWFDFNIWKDWRSAKMVFDSEIPITLVPCDVARKLRFSFQDVLRIQGELGSYLQTASTRWFWRALFLKFSRTVPVWDLLAAIYVLSPELFSVQEMNVTINGRGQVSMSKSAGKQFKIISGFKELEARQLYFNTLYTEPKAPSQCPIIFL
ncbi:MAG: nucleoside hydrolase [Pseudomonadota bacterium]|nr:nucleoside hydrolase [Pseudomonadota bacterium]